MDLEERVKRLEDLVAPDDQEGNVADALINLYGNFVQSLIWQGDFLFDLQNSMENMMMKISSLIPDELLEQLQEKPEGEPEVKLHLVTDPQES
tara:strand:- start:52 stop:330 length:279 start_codon:yes stop_codon:yes gene_type:complete